MVQRSVQNLRLVGFRWLAWRSVGQARLRWTPAGKEAFLLADKDLEPNMSDESEKPRGQKSKLESNLNSPEPIEDLEIHFHDLYHQLRSIGETLITLDYNLVDGVHLPGFGIALCDLAEK
jgi:hypothetical protein